MDIGGNIYSIWVDEKYVLKMSRSVDFANTWSNPVVISAPGANVTSNLTTYMPTMVQHPTQVNRAALVYYGSANGGKQYNAYIAETQNLNAANPSWTGFIANPLDQPMQNNTDGMWDQGYGDPLGDLVEFTDVKYVPGSTNFVAAFARSMCGAQSVPPVFYDTTSCVPGWNYTAHADSRWQGFVASGNH